MKKILIAVIGGVIVAGATAFYASNAWCVDCPIGRRCYGDLDCNTMFCNLSCVPLDKMGFKKICR